MFLTIGTKQINLRCILATEGIGQNQTGNAKLYVDARVAHVVESPNAHVHFQAQGVAVIELNGKAATEVREQWQRIAESRSMTA